MNPALKYAWSVSPGINYSYVVETVQWYFINCSVWRWASRATNDIFRPYTAILRLFVAVNGRFGAIYSPHTAPVWNISDCDNCRGR
jgi:hypothetical protein